MDLQKASLIIAVTFLVLVWLAVGLRCYVRVKMLNSWGIDDWCMLLTLVGAHIGIVVGTRGKKNMNSRLTPLQAFFSILDSFIIRATQHDPNAEGAALEAVEMTALKFQILSGTVYTATTCALKVSIAFLVLRITQERLHIHILRASIGFTCAYSLICFFLTLIQCLPVAYAWDISIQGGTCISSAQRAGIAYAFSALAIVTDWLYAILPIFIIWGLKMSRLLKLYITLVLGFGALACIATILRLTYIVQLASSNSTTREKLFTDPVLKVLIWSLIEPGIGIFAACGATLRPLLQYFKILGVVDGSENSTARWPRTQSSWHELSAVQEERLRKSTLGSKDGASSDVALCGA